MQIVAKQGAVNCRDAEDVPIMGMATKRKFSYDNLTDIAYN